jgi:hypothetical protein
VEGEGGKRISDGKCIKKEGGMKCD